MHDYVRRLFMTALFLSTENTVGAIKKFPFRIRATTVKRYAQ